MRPVRPAASPEVVESIASFLTDNPLTRSWADTMDRYVVSPVERMVVSDDAMRQGVAAMVADRLPEGRVLTEEQRRALEILKGAPVDEGALNADLAQMEHQAAQRRIGSVAENYMQDRYERDAASRAAAELVDGRVGLTQAGDFLRQFVVGSPVAAYGAVGAGGALGTMGAMEAYQMWLAQQQQAQKDGQLPLTQATGV